MRYTDDGRPTDDPDGLVYFRFEIPDTVVLDPAMACIDAPRVPLAEWAAAELSKDQRCRWESRRADNAFVVVIRGLATQSTAQAVGQIVAEHVRP